jgi:YegS/Rv2252/BmrU family lipid kinase
VEATATPDYFLSAFACKLPRDMSNTVVVINPKSQNGALGRNWPDLSRTLQREMGAFQAVMTQGPGDATRLAREALAGGADLVVAVGGDGTIHEVVNGFFDDQDRPVRTGAALGLIPYGTGGDFRKTVQVPKEMEGAGRILARGQRKTIDVGALRYRKGGARGPEARCMFINIASFGIGGLVDQIVNNSSKILGGKVSFLMGTARAAIRYKNQRVRMVFDGDEDKFVEATINNVAVANGQFFGGGMHIAPEAVLDDGQFDVVTLGDLTPFDFLKNGHRVYRGEHMGLEKVTSRRARRVEARPVNPDEDVLLDVDGEAPGALPATFTVIPRAIDLIVP